VAVETPHLVAGRALYVRLISHLSSSVFLNRQDRLFLPDTSLTGASACVWEFMHSLGRVRLLELGGCLLGKVSRQVRVHKSSVDGRN
jgi:hypothetical protein